MSASSALLQGVLEADLCFSDCLTPCETTELAIKWRVTERWVTTREVAPVISNPGLFACRASLLPSFGSLGRQHWMCRYRALGEVAYNYQSSPFSVYISCAYVAIQMFGGGTGNISPQNDAENIVAFACVVGGTMLWAIFVGAVCSVQTNLDPAEQVTPTPCAYRVYA